MKKYGQDSYRTVPFLSGPEDWDHEMIVTDPFGSYTGLVHDPQEKPVQDADDL